MAVETSKQDGKEPPPVSLPITGGREKKTNSAPLSGGPKGVTWPVI